MLQRRARISPRTLCVGLLAGAFLLLPAAALAQGFEGVVKQRTLELEGEAIWRVFDQLGGQEDEEYDESDEEWTEEDERRQLQEQVDKLLALPLDELLAMVRPEDAELGYSTFNESTFYMKGPMLRVEMGGETGGFGYFLVNANETAVTLVNPGEKYYVKWSPDDMDAMLADMGLDPNAMEAAAEPSEAPRIRSLGTTREINGVRAEAYRVEEEGAVTIGWVTGEYGELRASMKKIAERLEKMSPEDESDSAAEDLLWEKGVPVLIQTVDWSDGLGGLSVGGYEVTEVVSVERKSLAADVFKVPAGYTEKSLAELYGQG